MKYRKIRSNGPEVSVVSYGAWGISGKDWGETDDARSLEALHAALDESINMIDTADVYGFGHSDELIRTVLEERDDKDAVFIATKAGNDFYNKKNDAGEPEITPNYDKKYLIEAAEKSLTRLNVDKLDLLQLHSPDTDTLKKDAPWEALRTLKEQGKIKYAGLSIRSFQETEQAFLLDEHKDLLDVIQVRYNMLDREAEEVLFPKAQEHGIGVIARIPLMFGFLTGKYDRNATFGENDHRRFNLSREKLNEYWDKLEKLKPFFEKHSEYTWAQLALGFCLSHPAVSCVIPGGKTPEQVRDNVKAAEIDLSIYDELKK